MMTCWMFWSLLSSPWSCLGVLLLTEKRRVGPVWPRRDSLSLPCPLFPPCHYSPFPPSPPSPLGCPRWRGWISTNPGTVVYIRPRVLLWRLRSP